MRFLTIFVLIFLLSGCNGDTEKKSTDRSNPQKITDTKETTDTQETTDAEDTNQAVEKPLTDWVQGEYLPSKNFANICRNPRQNNKYQDLAGDYVDENNWIRSWSHETYLWYNELPDIDPANIQDPINYFEKMKTSAVTASGNPKDSFHYTDKSQNTQTTEEGKFYLRNTENYRQFSELGFSTGYGLKILVVKSTPPRKMLVAHTEPESPAALKQIARGTEIIAINGIDIKNASNEDYSLALSALFPQNTGEIHKFIIKDANKDYNRAVIMQSTQVEESPVITKIIQENDKKIGYMTLNTFGIASVEIELINSIKEFLGEQQTTENRSDTS